MKNLPEKHMHEIAIPILKRCDMTIDFVRTHKKRHSVAWAVATITAECTKYGWGSSAIAEYLGRNNATIIYHKRRVTE